VFVITAAKARVEDARRRAPFLDHLLRMYGRYQADSGDRLAAAVTFYWFLSLFPILLLAISLLGYLYGDAAPHKVSDALAGYLPGNLVATIGDTLVNAKGKAGLLGLVGLLLSGLGWVAALREAIRSIWHQSDTAGNIITRKLTDVVVLFGLFATISASVVVTGATTAATDYVIGLLHLAHSTAAAVFTQLLAYLLSGAADTMLFVFLFTRLPRVSQPIGRVLRAAVFGTVGFEVLKFAGAFYVARTTTKGQATYGAFAVVVGLLLFLNLISRLILMTAAFAVTRPYDSDAPPSGTAATQPADTPSAVPAYAEDVDHAPAVPVHGAATARRAGRAGVAAIGLVVLAVGAYALRTARALLLRR
jgi:membrane protein